MPRIIPNFKEPREHDEKHLKFIRSLPSCISGDGPCVAHHLLSVSGRGVARKADDRHTLPLTWEEHDELHKKCGSNGVWEERYFWDTFRINPKILARTLYALSGDIEAAEYVIHTHKCRRCYVVMP